MKPTLQLHSCVPALLAAVLTGLSHGQTTPPQLGMDANGNSLSDIYEALYPGAATGAADTDMDGVSNAKEAAAGTNPLRADDFLKVTAITNTGGSVTASWPSVNGKIYQLQRAASPAGPWNNEGAVVLGTGSTVSANTAVNGPRAYLRVQVSDVDSDADGLTDWEEVQAGTDRYLFDTDGDGRSDRNFVEWQMGRPNIVSVYPATTWANETGPRSGQFRITRYGGFMPISVNFTTGGTAIRDTDYVLPATSVQLPAGASEALVSVTPLADAEMEPAETIVLSLSGGSGYLVGGPISATITIVGQGLTGQYFNTSNGDIASPLNFDPAQLGLTRRDPAIDFNWSKTGALPPGVGTGLGTPDPLLITDDDVWGARWSGFIYPKTTGVYQIHAIADRGVMVWVSTSPITATGTSTGSRINVWSTASPSTKNTANMLPNSAEVKAGEPLYFRVDYRDTAGNPENANIQLLWSSVTGNLPEEVSGIL